MKKFLCERLLVSTLRPGAVTWRMRESERQKFDAINMKCHTVYVPGVKMYRIMYEVGKVVLM